MRWSALIATVALVAAQLAGSPVYAGLAEQCDLLETEHYAKPRERLSWSAVYDALFQGEDFNNSFALVIGLGKYAGWRDLKAPKRDAERVRQFLIEEGFDQIVTLIDDRATKQRIECLMEGGFPDLIGPNDRFLFYFSGHGTQRPVSGGRMRGYLPLSVSRKETWWNMVGMNELGNWAGLLAHAQQSLFVLDSCFSGLAGTELKAGESTDQRIERLSQYGHHIITAGTQDEISVASLERWGGSLFTDAMLKGFAGRADTRTADFTNDGVVSLKELMTYVENRIDAENIRMSPQIRNLSQDNSGEFFFITDDRKRKGRSPPGASVVARATPGTSKGPGDSTPAAFDVAPLDVSMIAATSRVNVRAGPGTTYEKVGSLDRGQAVDVTGKVIDKDWYRIALAGGGTGYVLGRQLSDSVPPPTQPAVGVFPEAPKQGESFKDCDVCPEMVMVPAGSFQMGSPADEEGREGSEGPVHEVTIARDFAVGKFEVTKAEYAAFVSATGYPGESACWTFEDNNWEERLGRSWRDPGYRQSDRDPAACLSWDDARAYTEWLSRKTGKRYRLLSEAEWEYAARSGTVTARPWGDGIGVGQANCYGCGSQWDDERTAPAGSLAPNAFGLYEMLGNVWEWTADCWNDNYSGAPTDGSARRRGECEMRVVRGGSWVSNPRAVRSADRSMSSTDMRVSDAGFRVARTD